MPLLDVTDLSIGFHMPGRDLKVVDKRIDEKLDDQGQQLAYGPRGDV